MTKVAEYDVIVIGAGPGGYVAGIRAAQLGLRPVYRKRRTRWCLFEPGMHSHKKSYLSGGHFSFSS